MNTKEVGDAIAARFAGVTATASIGGKTQTEGIAVGPTTELPNTIAKGPALLVFHPTGVLDVGVSRLRQDMLDYPVRLLRDPNNVPTRSIWIYAWIDAMRDMVEQRMTLGLPYVAWAQPVALESELDGALYAKKSFDLVELVVRVRFNEVVTTVAP